MKTFNEMTTVDSDTLMIVDSLNLGFRYMHKGATEFLDDYIRTVESLKRSYKAAKVIIAGDMGSSAYRRNIYPLYKQNRKDKYEKQTEEEKENFALFFKEMKHILDEYTISSDYPVIAFPGVEADDIAAYLVSKRKKYTTNKIWLISSDKDWDLLVADNVSRFSFVTRKEVTLENWNTHYEFTPEEYISIKCLTGDSGDNIPGVPGIGPKKSMELVKRYSSAYDIIAELPISSKYKYIQALNTFGADNLMLNYKLMDLVTYSEEAIGIENCKQIDKVIQEYLCV